MSSSKNSSLSKQNRGAFGQQYVKGVQFPNIIRQVESPSVGPAVVNTLEMSFTKQQAAAIKKQQKEDKANQLDDARTALVRLLIPPASYLDELRTMPEDQRDELPLMDLVRQAA